MVKKVYDYGKNLLFGEHSSSLKVSFVIMGISLLTKLLGIVTRSLVANRIGLNRDLDIFFAANIIPEMLANIFLFGALGAALVTILSLARKEKGDLGANKVLSIAITFSVIAFTLLALLSGIFADKLLPFAIENILKPTTPFSIYELDIITSIMRLMLFSQVLIGIGSFLSVGLQSIKRFIVPQLTGLFYGIGQIIGNIHKNRITFIQYKCRSKKTSIIPIGARINIIKKLMSALLQSQIEGGPGQCIHNP